MKKIRILCLSGSLRKVSYNSALLKAVQKLAPDGIEVAIFAEMGDLPLFNPDREEENISSVEELRDELRKADGLIIASPEYAHGISGVLKNALDWMVSGVEFPQMPVALLNAAPRATYAQAALREVITTMSGTIIENASVPIPLLGSNLDVNEIVNHPEISRILKKAIGVFRDAIIASRKPTVTLNQERGEFFLMESISPDVAKKFCEVCNWTYECWVTHKRLFDENDQKEATIEKADCFMRRLLDISQEYCLLQICKLHDPAIQMKSLNLTIDYILQYGNWGPDTGKIQRLVDELTVLFKQIRLARNKVLAHNDLKALMGSENWGGFPEGLDDKYFAVLQELVNEVHGKWCDGRYVFNDLAIADVDEFLQTLENS